MAKKNLDWLRFVDPLIVQLDQKPQFGLPTDFPWQKCEEALATLLERKKVELSHEVHGWMTAEETRDLLKVPTLPIEIQWLPLKSPALFLMAEGDLKKLMAEFLGGEKGAAYFYESPLVKGFGTYFGAEVLRVLDKIQAFPPLNPQIAEGGANLWEVAKKHPNFVITLNLRFNHLSLYGYVILNEAFRKEFKTHFATLPPSPVNPDKLSRIPLELTLEIGHAQLSLKEWKKVQLGDCILLDHCSYDPNQKKGSVTLALQEKPLFRGRFKDGGIKLMDYPLYEEVPTYMKKNNSDDFDKDDDDLYDDLDDGFEFDDEDDSEEESFSEEEEEENIEEEEVKEQKVPHSEFSRASSKEKPLPIDLEDLSVHLIVEVGRLKMSALEVTQLEAGNLLDLNVSPEKGVDLLIKGKLVGRGELVKIGENLGVRILDL